ncbi:MAG: amino acid adenylation domain-containing protein [Bacteroidota bacterium]
MNLQEVIKTARTEEYWRMHLSDISNTENSSFFETHIKSTNAITVEKVLLNKEAVTKVAELCNHSDVLIYNFYLTVFTILYRNYQKDIMLVSPTDQFEHVEAKNELFFIQPAILPNSTFKTVFSAQKEQLVTQLDYALPWHIIQEYFNEEGLLEEVQPSSFIIGKSLQTNVIETECIKTIFTCELDSAEPYFEITVKGEVYDAKLLTIFGENFNTTLLEVLEKTYEPNEKVNCKRTTETAILKDINTVAPYFSLDKNIVEIINENCKSFADKIAIKHNDEEISFAALASNSNQIASYLLDTFQGKTDDLFGIMMPRSSQMIQSILGIWKAGSAYVPIGIELPDENVLQIINNSNVKAIITDDEIVLQQLSRLDIEVPIVNLNAIQETLKTYTEETSFVQIQPNDLAYVIYTSGSTGVPKGVMIEHIGMLNHMGAKIHEIGINSESIVSQNAPHTFDISVWQMFASLVTGGQCIIYDNDDIVDVEKFSTHVSKDKITVLELVPSYLLEMLHYLEGENNALSLQLNNIVLNAETLTKPMVQRWLALYPNIPIINTYGATEVSDDTSHYFMESVPTHYSVPVMLKPIQHFEVFIVDEKLQQVPLGVKGEILLVGPCVGRGYCNDTEKTKKAYLQGPIAGLTAQERIYKTGDSGRFNADGTMEFIGRTDNQVKIRGHRIELDSIENIAASIQGIKNVKAVAYIDKQIIALYYMSEDEIDASLINHTLAEKLPKYMLPAAYMHMQRFPLTKNGKIDKKALPIPESDGIRSSSEYVEATTELEKQVVAIWQKVLDITKVGMNDIFFDLGGHSLKVMRLKNEYQKAFNIKLELKQLFENPKLASHCKIIQAASHTHFEAITPVAIQENYPLSSAQHRLWVLSQFQEGSIAYNIPYTIPMEIEDVALFKKAIDAVIDRHEILRTVFKENAQGEIRQWILSHDEINSTIADKEVASQQEVAAYIAEDSFKPFDLENGPLFRATLLKTAAGDYTFYFNMHHIISDGWSMEVLAKDVFAYYDYYMGKIAEVPNPLRIQYKDYAAWHTAQLETDAYQEHKNYWTQLLETQIPVLNLPSTKVRPTIKTYNGEGFQTYISTEISEKLRTYVGQEGGSLYSGLVALCNVLLYQYTGEKDISIGVPVAGRDHSDLEDQIGFYINTIILRNKIQSNQSFTEFYKVLKENTVTAFGHQMYPSDRLLEDLNITGIAGRNPLSDVLVDHNLALTQAILDIENTAITNLGKVLAKYDIEFHFTEANNGIIFQVNYNTDVYEAEMVQQLIQHFKQLIQVVLSAPNKPISEISGLSEKEEHHLLTVVNDTEVSLPENTTVINLFKEQVAANPEKIALHGEDANYSFAELDTLSNKLAQCLQEEHAINSTSIVALKLDRNEWYVIAALAVLKAGATFLPIDIKTPAEREQYILEDADAALFICSSDFMFDTSFTGSIFAIDIEFDVTQYENVAVNQITSWEQNAYIIYTSGSTGKPKGTVIGNK